MSYESMTKELRALSRKLLESGEVGVVIGYARGGYGEATRPVFITEPGAVDKLVWSPHCVANLAVYLPKKDVQQLGRPAIVAKGCDVRAIVVLMQEKQIEREDVVIIGMACEGMRDYDPRTNGAGELRKCAACKVRTPHVRDHLIGEELAPADGAADRGKIEELESAPLAERWAFWQSELERCIKCYACKAACPLCYCDTCFVEKTRPAWTSASTSPKEVFTFHLFRAFHLAGRCVGCGECERACPQGIRLSLLNEKLAKEVVGDYGYLPGMDAEQLAPLISFKKDDPEDFIL